MCRSQVDVKTTNVQKETLMIQIEDEEVVPESSETTITDIEDLNPVVAERLARASSRNQIRVSPNVQRNSRRFRFRPFLSEDSTLIDTGNSDFNAVYSDDTGVSPVPLSNNWSQEVFKEICRVERGVDPPLPSRDSQIPCIDVQNSVSVTNQNRVIGSCIWNPVPRIDSNYQHSNNQNRHSSHSPSYDRILISNNGLPVINDYDPLCIEVSDRVLRELLPIKSVSSCKYLNEKIWIESITAECTALIDHKCFTIRDIKVIDQCLTKICEFSGHTRPCKPYKFEFFQEFDSCKGCANCSRNQEIDNLPYVYRSPNILIEHSSSRTNHRIRVISLYDLVPSMFYCFIDGVKQFESKDLCVIGSPMFGLSDSNDTDSDNVSQSAELSLCTVPVRKDRFLANVILNPSSIYGSYWDFRRFEPNYVDKFEFELPSSPAYGCYDWRIESKYLRIVMLLIGDDNNFSYLTEVHHLDGKDYHCLPYYDYRLEAGKFQTIGLDDTMWYLCDQFYRNTGIDLYQHREKLHFTHAHILGHESNPDTIYLMNLVPIPKFMITLHVHPTIYNQWQDPVHRIQWNNRNVVCNEYHSTHELTDIWTIRDLFIKYDPEIIHRTLWRSELVCSTPKPGRIDYIRLCIRDHGYKILFQKQSGDNFYMLPAIHCDHSGLQDLSSYHNMIIACMWNSFHIDIEKANIKYQAFDFDKEDRILSIFFDRVFDVSLNTNHSTYVHPEKIVSYHFAFITEVVRGKSIYQEDYLYTDTLIVKKLKQNDQVYSSILLNFCREIDKFYNFNENLGERLLRLYSFYPRSFKMFIHQHLEAFPDLAGKPDVARCVNDEIEEYSREEFLDMYDTRLDIVSNCYPGDPTSCMRKSEYREELVCLWLNIQKINVLEEAIFKSGRLELSNQLRMLKIFKEVSEYVEDNGFSEKFPEFLKSANIHNIEDWNFWNRLDKIRKFFTFDNKFSSLHEQCYIQHAETCYSCYFCDNLETNFTWTATEYYNSFGNGYLTLGKYLSCIRNDPECTKEVFDDILRFYNIGNFDYDTPTSVLLLSIQDVNEYEIIFEPKYFTSRSNLSDCLCKDDTKCSSEPLMIFQ